MAACSQQQRLLRPWRLGWGFQGEAGHGLLMIEACPSVQSQHHSLTDDRNQKIISDSLIALAFDGAGTRQRLESCRPSFAALL
jgi:hypothetical protein